MKSLIVEVRQVAEEVRAGAEYLAPKLGFPKCLAGFCGIAAVAVNGAVAPVLPPGHHVTLVAGHCGAACHFWSEVRQGPLDLLVALVDVTATQFRPGAAVRVLAPGSKAAKRYVATVGDGARAERLLWHEDVDLMRLLPPRWWAVAMDPHATLDARLIAVLRRLGAVPTTAQLARATGASERETLEALGRLARRPPVVGHGRKADVGLSPAGAAA